MEFQANLMFSHEQRIRLHFKSNSQPLLEVESLIGATISEHLTKWANLMGKILRSSYLENLWSSTWDVCWYVRSSPGRGPLCWGTIRWLYSERRCYYRLMKIAASSLVTDSVGRKESFMWLYDTLKLYELHQTLDYVFLFFCMMQVVRFTSFAKKNMQLWKQHFMQIILIIAHQYSILEKCFIILCYAIKA